MVLATIRWESLNASNRPGRETRQNKAGQSAELQSGNPTLLVPNPDRLIDFGNEYFSVADLSR